jgi:hypothetical protein
MTSNELTSKQKWLQLLLTLAVTLSAGLLLLLVGSKAAPLGAVAAGMWATPYIELRTTRRQPPYLTFRQLAAIGVTIAFLLAELIARA